MQVFLLCLAVIALCIFGMSFNIIFRKDGEFPEYEVGSNKEMKRIGIKCIHQEEAERKEAIKGKKHINLNCNESCSDCRETECR